MLLDALERGVEVRHDLLTANHQDEVTRARRVRSHLASGGRCLDELPLLCQRVHAADLEVRRGHELAHLAGLRVAIHLERLEAKEVIAARLHQLLEDADVLQRLRLRRMDLCAVRNARHHLGLGFGGTVDDHDLEIALPKPDGQGLQPRVRHRLAEVFGACVHVFGAWRDSTSRL